MVIDVGSDIMPCLTDQTQFGTALLNLVVNAHNAMPSGGTIRIAAWRRANDDARRMPNLKPCLWLCDRRRHRPGHDRRCVEAGRWTRSSRLRGARAAASARSTVLFGKAAAMSGLKAKSVSARQSTCFSRYGK
jgi:signal transduction histidine kinase